MLLNSSKLHELTGAYLTGQIVQVYNNGIGQWVDETNEPIWFDGRERRIKPISAPPVITLPTPQAIARRWYHRQTL